MQITDDGRYWMDQCVTIQETSDTANAALRSEVDGRDS
jgi:hypothetical protein